MCVYARRAAALGVCVCVVGGLMSFTGQYVYMNFHKTPPLY